MMLDGMLFAGCAVIFFYRQVSPDVYSKGGDLDIKKELRLI